MNGDKQNVYELLAQKLEQIPPGFPRTADGQLEVRMLRWIFEQDQAEVALAVLPLPETAQTIAERSNKPVAGVAATLKTLADLGCLMPLTIGGQAHYRITPMIPGLQEPQFWRKDKAEDEKREFAAMWEEYYPTFAKVGSYGPAVARIIPVSVAVEATSKSNRLEDVHRMVDEAKTVTVMPCVCREERRLHGESSCNHSSQVCLLLTTMDEIDVTKWMSVAKQITKEEAHRIVDKSEEEGLIHETLNADDASFYFICNCCTCCCVLLRAAKEFQSPYIATSDFVARIDQDECNSCGVCADERCTMDAIDEDAGDYSVVAERCIGCGVCIVDCPVDAITLTRKPEANPPGSLMEWATQRETNRQSSL